MLYTIFSKIQTQKFSMKKSKTKKSKLKKLKLIPLCDNKAKPTKKKRQKK